MSLRRIMFKLKPFSPVVFGLLLGIVLSLLTAPREESCDTSIVNDRHGRGRKTNSVNEYQRKIESVDYKKPDDFEPRIRTQPKPREHKNLPKKFIRPRYASTELGIREKLFVAVLSSSLSAGAAQNKTLSHFIRKLVYFTDSEKPKNNIGMSVVTITNREQPLTVLKYISDRYPNAYDWIFLVTDDTYVRGEKLMDFVSDISVSRHLYAGSLQNGRACSISSGVILSQSVLSSVVSDGTWCSKNANSKDPSTNLQTCVRHATGLQCTDLDGSFKTADNRRFKLTSDVASEESSSDLDEVLTVGNITEDMEMYKTHKYFCERELKETRKLLEHTKDEILTLKRTAPGPLPSSWPIGVEKPFKPETRFDVLRWDYFTEHEIFSQDEFTNVTPLEGANKQDIEDIVKVAKDKLNSKYNGRYADQHLVNGYRRLDANRGMEYIIDLGMNDQVTGKEVVRRVQLVRPLSFVELVPMPYVTESTRLNLVVPVTVSNRDAMAKFLEGYAKISLDAGDNTNLLIALIYPSTAHKKSSDEDLFAGLKSSITFYENKYQNGAQITMVTIYKTNPNQIDIMDAVSRQFPMTALLVLCSSYMELTIDYLNRVRMNTIHKWQVFFPIPFQQYKPNLVYSQTPTPSTVNVKKNHGYFNTHSFDHCSFYNADYASARGSIVLADDLFDMFVRYKKLHVLHAVEPGLRLRYHSKQCNPQLSEVVYQRCLLERSEGLASRSQLARLVFDHQVKHSGGF